MKKTTQQIFGARLALLRTAHGMSQEQVAKVLNVSRSTYSYYESGKSAPSLDSLRLLIRLFCPDDSDYLLLIDHPETEDAPSKLLHSDLAEKAPPLSALSRTEKQLVAYARIMNDAQREKLMAYISQLVAEHPPEEIRE
ncbi:MAG: helix-turn-helix transcriptional regulator [Clostridia bacterium]|nr:helix-turn-helix transcriptional regulator [Clostridia bacterium]